MEDKKGYATALDQWMSEHGNVTDHIKGLRDQRYEVNLEIRAKAAGPMLQSLKETSEGVTLVQMQEQIVVENL